MHYEMTEAEREARMDARWTIIRTANHHRMKVHANNAYAPKLLGMKNLNHAVHVCRQSMLVSGKMLMQAGFLPHTSKVERPSVLRKLLGR